MIGKKGLGVIYVDLTFRAVDELLPADVARIGRTSGIRWIEVRLFLGKLRIAGEIRAVEVAIFGAPHAMVQQPKLEPRDFACFAIAYKPIVRVTTVVILDHHSSVVVNRIGILERLP